jgi:hypothetical protein
MTEGLPITQMYNLARLGNAGDALSFAADPDQRAAIARWAGLLSLEKLAVQVTLRKLAATRFGLDFTLSADITQASVVSLEPVAARLEHNFSRELQFAGTGRRKPVSEESGPDLVLDVGEDEGPEEIESLHYDLAGPVLEEFVLSLEPYPRLPGEAFSAPEGAQDKPESPFAVLKGLK